MTRCILIQGVCLQPTTGAHEAVSIIQALEHKLNTANRDKEELLEMLELVRQDGLGSITEECC
jgi:hypothetical protein